MKKLLFVLALLFMFQGHSLADGGGVLIDAVLLDNSPTSVTSDSIRVATANKVSFLVVYDETQVGNSVSAAVTVNGSWDNVTFYSLSFYDIAGGATLQSTETISADGGYFFWLNSAQPVPYIRVIITGTNTDADDTALVSVNYYTQN